MGDELYEHRTGHVANEAVGKLFSVGEAFEGSRGQPANKVGGGILGEGFGSFNHKRPFWGQRCHRT
jgi:hypothetical protein